MPSGWPATGPIAGPAHQLLILSLLIGRQYLEERCSRLSIVGGEWDLSLPMVFET